MGFEKLVLALNAGSSSLKASVIQGEETLVSFLCERLGTADATVKIKPEGKPKITVEKEASLVMGHSDALTKIIEYLEKESMLASLVAVGHRVVHGGTVYSDSVVIDDESYPVMDSLCHLAPLHQPANLAGVRAIRELLPAIPNVAVFDTSFHCSIPEKAYQYPIPLEYRNADIRKYGFHGTSVKYVSQKTSEMLGAVKSDAKSFEMLICHLGNGASLTAVSGDKSMDTSMGFTPLPGLMMGTRCGDIDPSLPAFVCSELNKTIDEVVNDLNKKSGLKGMISDGESDMRVLLERDAAGDAEAQLCVEMFVYRLVQNMAQYLVALNGPVDAIVFTAGMGENASVIRERAIEQLSKLIPTLSLDKERNAAHGSKSDCVISTEGAWPQIMVVPTDEEVMIAKECIRLVL